MNEHFNILHLESSQPEVQRIERILEREQIPCRLTWVNRLEAFESALQGGRCFDLFLAGCGPAESWAETALALVRGRQPEAPFLVLADPVAEDTAAGLLNRGATELVSRDSLARLGPALRRALNEVRLATALAKAETTASRLVALLRTTLETTTDGMIVVNLAGRITTYNRKFMSLCGIPDYVMAPMDLDRVIQYLADQFQDPQAFMAEAQAWKRGMDEERTGLLKLPDERVLEQRSRPHRLDQQEIGRVFSFQDVSAREQSVAQLTATVVRLKEQLQAVAAGGVVPWTLTADSLELAESALAVLMPASGTLPRDLSGLEGLIHPEERDRFRQGLEQPHGAAFDLRMRKGKRSWIWTHWSLQRSPGKSYHGCFTDITEQRQQEEAQAEQRRHLGMAAIATGINRTWHWRLRQCQEQHEQLCQGDGFGPDPLPAREAVSRHLAQLQAALAAVATIGHCQPDSSQPADFEQLLEDLQTECKACQHPAVSLSLEPGPQLPPLFMAPHHLKTLVQNLVRNAREAMPDGGRIRLRIEPIPSGHGSPDQVGIEVRDSGPGVPQALRNRMFEPFFSARQQAFGLGLAEAQAIARSYGGSVECLSEPGPGACLRVTLPTGPGG